MLENVRRIRLLTSYWRLVALSIVAAGLGGHLLSACSADELRSVEGRYQAQLVQDKARQIELYGQRYRDVVSGWRARLRLQAVLNPQTNKC